MFVESAGLPVVHENLYRSDSSDIDAESSRLAMQKELSNAYVDVMANRKDEVDTRLLKVMLTNIDKAAALTY